MNRSNLSCITLLETGIPGRRSNRSNSRGEVMSPAIYHKKKAPYLVHPFAIRAKGEGGKVATTDIQPKTALAQLKNKYKKIKIKPEI